jgi:hypothetical protein
MISSPSGRLFHEKAPHRNGLHRSCGISLRRRSRPGRRGGLRRPPPVLSDAPDRDRHGVGVHRLRPRTGKTPLTVDSLRGGKHALRLVQSDLSSWLTGCINDTVFLAPGEQRTLRYAFDRRVMVVTDPSGAIVSIGDSIAGTTPLLLVSRSSDLPSSVTVERKGYEKTAILLPAGNRGCTRGAA